MGQILSTMGQTTSARKRLRKSRSEKRLLRISRNYFCKYRTCKYRTLQIQDLLLQIRVPWRARNTLDKIGKRSGYFQIRRNMSCRSAEFVLARWLRRSLRRRHPEHLLKSLTLDLSRNRGRSSQGRPQSDRLQNLLNLLDALRRPPLAAEKNLKLDR